MATLNIPMNERVCQFCNNNKTQQWYNIDNKSCCMKCYKNKKRMRYKDKHIILKECFKTNVCSKCGKTIGDQYINKKGEIKIIKQIQRHHYKYDDINPMKYSYEVCVPCHNYKGKPRINPSRIDRKLNICPKCNSTDLIKNGVEHLAQERYQRYKCKGCKSNSY